MVRVNVLRDCLKSMVNAERAGKREVLTRPCSKVVVKFLQLMQKKGYIGDFDVIDDHRGGKIRIQLTGRLNKAGVISPRFDVAREDLSKWVTRLLPSRLFGHVILTTSSGIMDHSEAYAKKIGGKVIGYFW
ncbi:Ribosomal protein S8 like protein [Aduncisulcus paluster]|uniref:Ribosomal protein S8 like protein n=1 Tax=Aduncisulcus paluster TaxID=2918883 RepID=A0ABQ5K261_9EUKA|nr:Ribosomal protein S8 like protein [Aduncisulcus paluster]